MSANSFGARDTLRVGDASYEIYRLDRVEGSARLPYSLKILLENLLRTEDGANITEAHINAVGPVGPDGRAERGDPVHPGPRDHAGLHRRAVRGRPGHHARGRARPRRRRRPDQPARARRDGHRPLGHRRLLRRPRLLPAQRREGIRAQPRALPVPALGPDRLRRVQGRAPGHRHRPPGEHRTPRPRGHDPRRQGLPRHVRRHRLPHHDGERHRRAGLGRRRHRGRGRDARPADLDAHPARGRLQADRQAPGRGDRHRPGAHHHRDPAQARRGRQVRRVLRRGRLLGAAGQPGHDRQHEPRVRLHLRDLPDRPGDDQLPDADRPHRRADRPGRGLRQGAGPLARPPRRARLLRVHRARPVHRGAVDRRAQAPAGPHRADRVEGDLAPRRARLRHRLRRRRRRRGQRGVRSRPPTRPPPTPAPAPPAPTRRSRSPWPTAPASRSTTAW